MFRTRNVVLLTFLPALFLLAIYSFPTSAFATTCDFGANIGSGQCRGFLTSTTTTTWTVPADWNNSSNKIEAIAGGGGGGGSSTSHEGSGGGGGAYCIASDVSLTPGGPVNIQVGSGGGGGAINTNGTNGGDTWFNGSSATSATCGAGGGKHGIGTSLLPAGGAGGSTGSGTVSNGGAGGDGSVNGSNGGTGGGGAAGPYGPGAAGGATHSGGNGAGTGGGGNGGGSAGAGNGGAFPEAGANGGNNHAGTGHGTGGNTSGTSATSGTNGGGGGGAAIGFSAQSGGGNGGAGIEWDASHGSGGGGGGGGGEAGVAETGGGNGALYGGGGGGAGTMGITGAAGGNGASGIIVITYTPSHVHLAQSNTTSISNGLVGHWPLNGPATNWSTDTTQDTSGNGDTGNLISMSTTTSPVPGKIGGALMFNGSTQYAQSVSPYTSVSNWTLSAWIKPAVLPELSQAVYDGNDAGGYGFGVGNGAGVSGSKLQLLFGSVNWLDPSYTLTAGQWYHVVMTRDSATTRVYVNGSALSTTFSNTPGTLVNLFSIGMEPNGSNSPYRYFDGIIDDVRIYNRALSAQEVQQLYHLGAVTIAQSNTVALSSGLVGHWPLNGPATNWSTDTTQDTSGNGDTGNLISMSTTTSPVPGKIGGALSFNGSSSYISTTNQFSNPSVFTLSAWFKTTVAGGHKIVSLENAQTGTGSVDSDRAIYVGTDGKLYFLIWNGSSAQTLVSASTVTDGKWHSAIAVYNNGSYTMYLDGVSQGTGSGTAQSYSGYWRIGSYLSPGGGLWPNAATGYFAGAIDDVRVYNRALSAQEVQQLYHLGTVNI